MIFLMSICLIIVTVLLNFIFIFVTRKFKCYEPIIELGEKYRRECIGLLNKLWKKQIIIIALGITLCFLALFIDVDNRVALNTFLFLSSVYNLSGIILGIYNYNSFNKSISILLNKTSK